jgi:protein tyrosine/serine phosphatase
MNQRWVELTGAVNVRDLGGLPTTDGSATRFGRVLRSDNLQDLTPQDVDRLVGTLRVRHVIDLRTTIEVVQTGPGPLTRVPDVTIHHHSLMTEHLDQVEIDAATVLPWSTNGADQPREWVPAGQFYSSFLEQRPDSVVAALRAMTGADGAAIAHCAAGKDRTGVICALALSVAGVRRDAIVADYALTADRFPLVHARLSSSTTYAADLADRPIDSHLPKAEFMVAFLDAVDQTYGGPLRWLEANGWTSADTNSLRTRLLSA